ncbi:MAG: hypothetical protein AAGK32_06630 [Actinomycetota bacterium]
MEKLIYLVWDRPSVDAAARLDDVRARVEGVRDAGGRSATVYVRDQHVHIEGPAPAPPTELPLVAAVSAWLPAHDRRAGVESALDGLGVRRAGYLVTEATWCEYGENDRRGPRDWPAGERSPGITTFSLVHRDPRLDPRSFRELWYGHQSPMSEAVQPRWRYVRNTVVHPVTPGAPPVDGIVAECWPSEEVVADHLAFHGGAEDPAVGEENLRVMLDSVDQLFQLDRLRSVAMSEYLYTDP